MTMNKFLSISIIFLISGSTISFMPSHNIAAQKEYNLPSWIMQLKAWQTQGKIDNLEFTNAIEYLVKQGVLSAGSAEELLEAPHPPGQEEKEGKCADRDFPIVDWSSCDLSGASLSHANLHDSNLAATNLSRSNLQSAYMIDSTLRDANLDYADMTNADLVGADLQGASMIGIKEK